MLRTKDYIRRSPAGIRAKRPNLALRYQAAGVDSENGPMRQQWADYRVFLREFRRTFESTGAVMPSGAALSDMRSRTSCGKVPVTPAVPAGAFSKSGRAPAP